MWNCKPFITEMNLKCRVTISVWGKAKKIYNRLLILSIPFIWKMLTRHEFRTYTEIKISLEFFTKKAMNVWTCWGDKNAVSFLYENKVFFNFITSRGFNSLPNNLIISRCIVYLLPTTYLLILQYGSIKNSIVK